MQERLKPHQARLFLALPAMASALAPSPVKIVIPASEIPHSSTGAGISINRSDFANGFIMYVPHPRRGSLVDQEIALRRPIDIEIYQVEKFGSATQGVVFACLQVF